MIIIDDHIAEIDPFVQRSRSGTWHMHWLDKIINERGYAIGAEIGVAKGCTTKHLLFYNHFLHLYAVDAWAVVSMDSMGNGHIENRKLSDFKATRKQFDKATSPFEDRLTVLHGISWEMADKVNDNTLDFVFIDACHEYRAVLKDIGMWTPKLKPNGTICGHDINLSSVKMAVNELIPKYQHSTFGFSWEARKEDVLL